MKRSKYTGSLTGSDQIKTEIPEITIGVTPITPIENPPDDPSIGDGSAESFLTGSNTGSKRGIRKREKFNTTRKISTSEPTIEFEPDDSTKV